LQLLNGALPGQKWNKLSQKTIYNLSCQHSYLAIDNGGQISEHIYHIMSNVWMILGSGFRTSSRIKVSSFHFNLCVNVAQTVH
jgi:hypothetical protein